MLAETDGRRCLAGYAALGRKLWERAGPLVLRLLSQAAAGDADLRAFTETVERQRAAAGATGRAPWLEPRPRRGMAGRGHGRRPARSRILGPDRPRPGLDGRAQGPERLAAVGGGVLGRLVDLGAGPVPAVGQEHRVVAEPAAPPRALQHPPLPGRLGMPGAAFLRGATASLLEPPGPPARIVKHGRAAEPGRAPLRRHPRELGQELVQVGLVTGPLAGVAGRADPGGAAEGVDL